jgi:hypothetical protein
MHERDFAVRPHRTTWNTEQPFKGRKIKEFLINFVVQFTLFEALMGEVM